VSESPPFAASVTVKLSAPVQDAGVELPSLTMRRPKVRDQLIVDAMNASQAQKEIAMYANLCEVSPDALKDLYLSDYRALQEAFESFLKKPE
jgi:hypothetical protein